MDAEEYEYAAGMWRTSLRAGNKSGETIKSYLNGAMGYAKWCAVQGTGPDLTPGSVEAYIAGLLEAGQASTTATARQLAVRQFSAWLAAREVIPRDLLAGLRPPKLDKKVVDALSAGQLAALLAACRGRRFTDIRDRAIIRFMAEAGARAEEVVAMKTYDMQVGAGSCVIVRGKGGKGRRSGFGPKTADAIGHYLMARRRHPLAGREELWLAERGRVLNYQALYKELRRRGEAAGIEGFHPHMLRHTAAVRWLRAGGTVTGLMSQCGWQDVAMVQRYVETASAELAVEESHRLRLDDV